MEQASGILQRIVDDAVAQALKRLPPEELPRAAWEFAAGRAVAEKTRVLGCEAKVLRVEVADANWRAQLSAMAPQYVARLRPLLAVERIEFEVAGPKPTGIQKQQQNQNAKSTTPLLPTEGRNGAPAPRSRARKKSDGTAGKGNA